MSELLNSGGQATHCHKHPKIELFQMIFPDGNMTVNKICFTCFNIQERKVLFEKYTRIPNLWPKNLFKHLI